MLQRWGRVLKHRWTEDSLVARHFPVAVQHRVAQAVAASEQRHRGEIRVLVEGGLPTPELLRPEPLAQIIRQRAIAEFAQLGVWDTEHNNGVLIYVLLAERAIEIVADRGLNRWVGPDAWQQVLGSMRLAFQQGEFERGLNLALQEAGRLLEAYFPLTGGSANRDELPNAPVVR